MSFQYRRRYTGPIQAIIADWAGTTVDFGCLAPVMAFQAAFEAFHVPITRAEARGPMGMDKLAHVREVLLNRAVAARWEARHGEAPTEADVRVVYEAYMPRQLAAIRERTKLVPGWLAAYTQLREQGLRFASNTGYNREMAHVIETAAAAAGYRPDHCASADDVRQGRPTPAMALLNASQLDISDVSACLKVDDTVPGIEEGLAAGMWTVGVSISGNAVGVDVDAWSALPGAEQESMRAAACQQLLRGGAHWVIDSVADLPALLPEINARLARGERP